MDSHHFKNIPNFYIAGINYKKSDATVRGKFAVSTEQYDTILQRASLLGLNELFILSTCNRTEIYGFAHSPRQLVDLLCSETAGGAETFLSAAYIKTGSEAVEHVFNVGAGLDSQILGDYEIVGQLKTAVKFAKERGFVGAFIERLINAVLQASKGVKNNTVLSGGTVSVAFAAVQYIANMVVDAASKKTLLIGTGKIGRAACKNLVDYIGTNNITLINRSADKAESLATSLGLCSATLDQFDNEVAKADIILVASNAAEPVLLKQHLQNSGKKLVIDLSIPCNVEASVQELPNVQLVNVDKLSKIKDDTLRQRQAEVPKARCIIGEVMLEFAEWSEMRRHVPMLKDLKLKLKELYTHPQYTQPQPTCSKTMEVQIQRVLNNTAGKVKAQNQRGCQYLSALNDFINVNN